MESKPPSVEHDPPSSGGELEHTWDEVSPTADRSRSTRRFWLEIAQRTFLLLALYVLSIGPMYWHWYNGKFVTGSKVVAAFYEPLFIAANLIGPFGEWLDWYVELWIC